LGVGGEFFATLFFPGCVIGSKFFVCDEEDENWRNANSCRETICVENFYETLLKVGAAKVVFATA
jgi:hypothetical protein